MSHWNSPVKERRVGLCLYRPGRSSASCDVFWVLSSDGFRGTRGGGASNAAVLVPSSAPPGDNALAESASELRTPSSVLPRSMLADTGEYRDKVVSREGVEPSTLTAQSFNPDVQLRMTLIGGAVVSRAMLTRKRFPSALGM